MVVPHISYKPSASPTPQMSEESHQYPSAVGASSGADDISSIDHGVVAPSLKRASSNSNIQVDSFKRTKINTAADEENMYEPTMTDEGKARAVSSHFPDSISPLFAVANGELCQPMRLRNLPRLFADFLDPNQSRRSESIVESFKEYVTNKENFQDIATLRGMK